MLPKKAHAPASENDSRRKSQPSWDSRELSAVIDHPSIHRGLCINCDVRETCTFPKPEGGVWFCEEYQ
jgi:hypothetical protein